MPRYEVQDLTQDPPVVTIHESQAVSKRGFMHLFHRALPDAKVLCYYPQVNKRGATIYRVDDHSVVAKIVKV